MVEVPGTLEGWYVLHDFRTVDWKAWRELEDRPSVVDELASWLDGVEAPEKGGSALYSIAGHRADLMAIHLRPTIDHLIELERSLSMTRFGGLLRQNYSYLSVTELSLYEAYARGGTEDREALMQQPFVQRRLYFEVPDDMPYACFYPMNKRRGETVNWYAEEMEERRRMMREHGATGRKYHGRVLQMITGSTGLDDWEWGVTLFARDPLDIKKLVYEMRFDEVSAKYGEFGPFQIGARIRAEELCRALGNVEE